MAQAFRSDGMPLRNRENDEPGSAHWPEISLRGMQAGEWDGDRQFPGSRRDGGGDQDGRQRDHPRRATRLPTTEILRDGPREDDDA